MQEIKGYYNEIGLFENYVGEIFVSGNRLMLSIYNAILGISLMNYVISYLQ